MTELAKCIGCGATLQSTNPKEAGYVPTSSLDKDDVICKRCFRLKHYNEVQDVELTSEDFLNMLKSLRNEDGLIVNVVDVFDLEGSMIHRLKDIVGKKKVVLVANKIDILPKAINKRRVEIWLRNRAKDFGLNPDEVVLISAFKNQGIDELLDTIEKVRNNKDVYVVGTTNVGKSTLINRLIEKSVGEKEVITTSHFPGTTLDMIDIPLDDDSYMFDTPGIIQSHQMTHYVTDKELKIVMPKKEIKPKVYQLNEEQSLFLGGLVRVDYLQGGRRSLTCFVSNELNIHRTKLEKAEDLWQRQIGELLAPPYSAENFDFDNLKTTEIVTENERKDIMISGLGFVTVDEGAQINIVAPSEVEITIRKSIL
ncbi:ribosome biogenesis GTPase YqeH [Mammaliicoccus stepanovicii]|uniref:GTP-binding protein n=1 Tax=Mammaliicoccus stepanovicii TaxID=643214 RepID=A0A239Z354_9STAP|nr:ribosome biogenesis GTPase YqeH [Mammaliicoccus stepanovicii]PNZ72429.1 ribosome biogenesis GTPase YqeH [Mammaliicoccus stepanovicii]GGI40137.1 ribosome biogenesis GTPase YqeH [Mammaliicoccus stepanovicii]SNV65841.1 GTP-binding protein [Mammaliicoccus stepanovicii]